MLFLDYANGYIAVAFAYPSISSYYSFASIFFFPFSATGGMLKKFFMHSGTHTGIISPVFAN